MIWTIIGAALAALGFGAHQYWRGRRRGVTEAEEARRVAVAKATIDIQTKEDGIDRSTEAKREALAAESKTTLQKRPTPAQVEALIKEAAEPLKKALVAFLLVSVTSARVTHAQDTVSTSTAGIEWQTELEERLWKSSEQFRAKWRDAEARYEGEREKNRVRSASISAALSAIPAAHDCEPGAPPWWLWSLAGIAVGAGSAALIAAATSGPRGHQ